MLSADPFGSLDSFEQRVDFEVADFFKNLCAVVRAEAEKLGISTKTLSSQIGRKHDMIVEILEIGFDPNSDPFKLNVLFELAAALKLRFSASSFFPSTGPRRRRGEKVSTTQGSEDPATHGTV